jgi:hypothetical protein
MSQNLNYLTGQVVQTKAFLVESFARGHLCILCDSTLGFCPLKIYAPLNPYHLAPVYNMI